MNFIYHYLLSHKSPIKPAQIAEALSISVNQANYAIKKLRENGLIYRLLEGWVCIELSSEELETLFEEVQGKGQARVERFRRERQFRAADFLLEARYRVEGETYLRAASDQEMWFSHVQKVLDDPVIELGVELGGIVALPFGSYLSSEGITWIN